MQMFETTGSKTDQQGSALVNKKEKQGHSRCRSFRLAKNLLLLHCSHMETKTSGNDAHGCVPHG
jgi:hypothetical protein